MMSGVPSTEALSTTMISVTAQSCRAIDATASGRKRPMLMVGMITETQVMPKVCQ